MSYWLHRCARSGGHEILDNEHRLTIGFADAANDSDMVKAVKAKDGQLFDDYYEQIYKGDIWPQRWHLWYFTCDMKADDIVVVPRHGGFTICKLKGEPIVSERPYELDIGWEWDVDILADFCAPRDAYASAPLFRRMKCQQTTLKLDNLKDDVDQALTRFREKRPFVISTELAKKSLELLSNNCSDSQLEEIVCNYFNHLGASAEVLPKNYSDKVGDCDVQVVFSAVRLQIFVQVKLHSGKTGEWAVQQITDYDRDMKSKNYDPNWTYACWVVSLADDFTDEAKKLADEKGVLLINGLDFCSMLVEGGLGIL